MAHHAEVAARATQPIDYRDVFERAAPACLLLEPHAPRFSVLAASDAFFSAAGVPPRAVSSQAALEFLEACGVSLSPSVQVALGMALEAAAAGGPARVPLGAAKAGAGAGGSAEVAERNVFALGALTPVLRNGVVTLLVLELQREGGVEQEDARRELGAARAELEAFGYSVSHDLRSPLRAIDGFAQALTQDCGGALDERALHYLERVRAGAQRMSSLLDDLLELSRIQLAPLERVRVDVSELARRTSAAVGAKYPGRTLDVNIESGLSIDADARLLGILLTKLLDNAYKFTARQAHPNVRVGRDGAAGPAVLFVADDGVGFDMAYAKRLFSPFQRLHRAADYAGNGIGLAVAQRIVARHGGRIWAEAAPDQGARFCFDLNRAAADG